MIAGLEPCPAMKDSGVGWLGEVPEHWEVVTLRRVIHSAIDGPHHSPSYVDDGIPFMSARNIKVNCWSLEEFTSVTDFALAYIWVDRQQKARYYETCYNKFDGRSARGRKECNYRIL